jgi:inhibitor of the pro-sigma K processing machinery
MGSVGIYFLNYLFTLKNISLAVGINPATVLTSGILGFPGLVVLYGINLFKIL